MSSTTTTTTPIPYLLLGKFPGHIQATSEISKPEYEVVLARSSVADAIAVLPTLLTGGEIDGTTYPAIKLVMMGGGFSPTDFAAVYEVVPGAKSVPWVRPAVFKPGAPRPPSGGPPSAEVVARRMRTALVENLDYFTEGKGQGEEGVIWWA